MKDKSHSEGEKEGLRVFRRNRDDERAGENGGNREARHLSPRAQPYKEATAPDDEEWSQFH
jgi:hypothetical protein